MFYLLLVINLITFLIFALDKWKASRHKRRISELTLLSLVFFGGTIGAVLGILIFRHKISKKSFLWKLFIIIIIIVQALILIGWYQFDFKNFNY